MAVLDRKELEESPLSDLHAIASELGIEGFRLLRREKLIDSILGNGGAPDEEEERPRPRRSRGGRSRTRKPAAPKEAEAEAETEAKAEPESDAPDADDDESGEVRSGILDILPNGSGFMRPQAFTHSNDDVYVSPAQIRRCELRSGDEIEGSVRAPRRNERHPSLVRVDKVNGTEAEPPADRPRFEQLTPVFASERLKAPDG